MVSTEIINQQPLCLRSEEQMTLLRRSHWPCSTVTLLGDTVLFLQPDFVAWKIFLIPPAFLLWKTDLEGFPAPAFSDMVSQTIPQSPQTRGKTSSTPCENLSYVDHSAMARNRVGISLLSWSQTRHSCADHSSPSSLEKLYHSSRAPGATCSLSLKPWPDTPAALLFLSRIL